MRVQRGKVSQKFVQGNLWSSCFLFVCEVNSDFPLILMSCKVFFSFNLFEDLSTKPESYLLGVTAQESCWDSNLWLIWVFFLFLIFFFSLILESSSNSHYAQIDFVPLQIVRHKIPIIRHEGTSKMRFACFCWGRMFQMRCFIHITG